MGSLKLKFRSLFLKIKKHWQEKGVSVIYWERESNQLSKWNAFACICRNPAAPESGPELDLPIQFTRKRNGTFPNWPDFWFTFPYRPNFWPILDQFAGFFPYPCVNATSLPTVFLERTKADQYAIAPMAVWTGPIEMHKICLSQLSKFKSA